ncbi:A/G-specific adenine glycosylase [Aliidiomarina soli]|uniref:Adenine DNA glycosylase n=2 Tax=Aliidiomarina soli TaxID=1928574 RepID=A0A432WGJ9_9GAMM|nr:A/G-specific adenine glycosylase [Aliidiomarina soli]
MAVFKPVTLFKSSSLCGLAREKQVKMPLTPSQVHHIRQQVINWQAEHGRHDLPWQQDVTPYRVHVSEIMLQQTQVTTVIPYFQRWMADFPTLSALASASEDEVMAHWQGLGYYSRARNLRKAAQHLIEQHAGHYPDDLKSLNDIPGIGRYTAGAIRSFAFSNYGPIVDGNVKRLYARLFAIYGEPNSSAVNKTMWQHAELLTPEKQSERYSQGVLDLGATLCKKSNPECQRCPLQENCFAFQQNKIGELPSAKKRKTKPVKDAHFAWLINDTTSATELMLEKRQSPGIWGGLWCIPQLTEQPYSARLVGEFTHEFSHYRLQAKVWAHQLNSVAETANAQRLYPLEQLDSVGLPTPIRNFINDMKALSKNDTN